MRGDLQGLQGIYLQMIVDAFGKLRAQSRQALKQPHGLQGAAQAVDSARTAGGHNLMDRARDSGADMGQFDQSLGRLRVRSVLVRSVLQCPYGVGGPAIGVDAKRVGVLLFEKV